MTHEPSKPGILCIQRIRLVIAHRAQLIPAQSEQHLASMLRFRQSNLIIILQIRRNDKNSTRISQLNNLVLILFYLILYLNLFRKNTK